jgi:ABC-type nitrate/sulfonate/bicarbonate transport system substrate-binding protein
VSILRRSGITQQDVKLVLLQHSDGRTTLERGDVAAWAGLDPMMAASSAGTIAIDGQELTGRIQLSARCSRSRVCCPG